MKWIKASERLPEKNKRVPLKFMGRYGCGTNVCTYIVDDHMGTLDDSEVEWLDESPTPPHQSWKLLAKEFAADGWKSIEDGTPTYDQVKYEAFLSAIPYMNSWVPVEIQMPPIGLKIEMW